MSALQDNIDILYSAIEKLKGIQDDIHYSWGNVPFDDEIAREFIEKNGFNEINSFSHMLLEAASFAQKSIELLENSHSHVANY